MDKLIEDKIGSSDWECHLGASESWFVNASTWGLMLTGRVLKSQDSPERNFRSVLQRMVRRSGEPVIRQAVRQAMRIMGRQFVMGRTIDEALQAGPPPGETGLPLLPTTCSARPPAPTPTPCATTRTTAAPSRP
ncbi:MAG: hypothetical protein U5L11_03015 [Arhodomonas sp.]|nr:hypothetical protein [Arhodomonas sp.]